MIIFYLFNFYISGHNDFDIVVVDDAVEVDFIEKLLLVDNGLE